MTSHLIAPHGGELVQLQVPAARAAELKAQSKDWPSWDLTARQLCDLELLMSGGFSPLRGFMNRDDYERVCQDMRLADGTLWPMPITLDVTEDFAKKLTPGTSKIALRDPEGVMLAALSVEDVWFSALRAPHIPEPITRSTNRIPGTWAERLKNCNLPRIMTSVLCALLLPSCAPNSAAWGGRPWLGSRPAIPCIVRTSN
jgi:hypothetical protein